MLTPASQAKYLLNSGGGEDAFIRTLDTRRRDFAVEEASKPHLEIDE